ncbi:MAG: phosphatidate cytidylyltransferase [Burkholderiales bacterium]
MLKTRVITAVALLVVLLLILYLNSYAVFALAAAVFFGAAAWESMRLFGARLPLLRAALWTAAFLFIAFRGGESQAEAWLGPQTIFLFGLSSVFWVIRLTPLLATGLPPLDAVGNRFLNWGYGIAILACFVAMLVLFKHSSLYLLSVLAIVWIADIGAYFAGKAFGKRKLAPSISPAKSWEGAVGGWLAVLSIAAASTRFPALRDTFAVKLLAAWRWPGLVAALTLIVAASIVGDLFESQLKRRIGMKDSSNLLPGHGGVLDRFDALIPVLPFAVFIDYWL